MSSIDVPSKDWVAQRARAVFQNLSQKPTPFKLGHAYDLTAIALGYESWHVLSAHLEGRLGSAVDAVPPIESPGASMDRRAGLEAELRTQRLKVFNSWASPSPCEVVIVQPAEGGGQGTDQCLDRASWLRLLQIVQVVMIDSKLCYVDYSRFMRSIGDEPLDLAVQFGRVDHKTVVLMDIDDLDDSLVQTLRGTGAPLILGAPQTVDVQKKAASLGLPVPKILREEPFEAGDTFSQFRELMPNRLILEMPGSALKKVDRTDFLDGNYRLSASARANRPFWSASYQPEAIPVLRKLFKMGLAADEVELAGYRLRKEGGLFDPLLDLLHRFLDEQMGLPRRRAEHWFRAWTADSELKERPEVYIASDLMKPIGQMKKPATIAP